MNSEQLRSWSHAHVETWRAANYPDLQAFYENGPVPDPRTVGNRWLDVIVNFSDTHFAAVGSRPPLRDTGSVKLMVYTREGQATRDTDLIIESLREYFRSNNRAPGVTLWEPRRHSAPPALGWCKSGLMIPFTSDVS